MAQRCGWCVGEGCANCPGPRKRYFPKAKPKAKREGYAFDQAHKCGPGTAEFLYTRNGNDVFLCSCGSMIREAN